MSTKYLSPNISKALTQTLTLTQRQHPLDNIKKITSCPLELF